MGALSVIFREKLDKTNLIKLKKPFYGQTNTKKHSNGPEAGFFRHTKLVFVNFFSFFTEIIKKSGSALQSFLTFFQERALSFFLNGNVMITDMLNSRRRDWNTRIRSSMRARSSTTVNAATVGARFSLQRLICWSFSVAGFYRVPVGRFWNMDSTYITIRHYLSSFLTVLIKFNVIYLNNCIYSRN